MEGIAADRLGAAASGRDLFASLQIIKTRLENPRQRNASGWTDLEYHPANKIRLVRGHTHATGPAKSGRRLRPEFALSTVEDLIDHLIVWGYSQPQDDYGYTFCVQIRFLCPSHAQRSTSRGLLDTRFFAHLNKCSRARG